MKYSASILNSFLVSFISRASMRTTMSPSSGHPSMSNVRRESPYTRVFVSGSKSIENLSSSCMSVFLVVVSISLHLWRPSPGTVPRVGGTG